MKRWIGLAFVPILAIALSACGLIPPIPVSDPFHVDGAAVNVVFGPGPGLTASAITPQSVPGTGSGETTFEDGSAGDVPLTPSKIASLVGFVPSVELSGADGDVDTITLTDFVLTVRVWDGAATYDAASTSRRVELTATYDGPMTLSSDTLCVSHTTCQFTITSASYDLFNVTATGAQVATLEDIVTTGGGSNHASATLTVIGASGPTVDGIALGTLSFTVYSVDGELSF